MCVLSMLHTTGAQYTWASFSALNALPTIQKLSRYMKFLLHWYSPFFGLN